jgi:glycosyltransferase involved in cell wall biosynthesis
LEAAIKARSFARLFPADLVYSLQFLNKMSPAVLDGFRLSGLPVVLRISDFGLICPESHLYDGRKACTDCIHGNFLHGVKKQCVMDSLSASLVRAAALTLHRVLGCRSRISAFVFPSRFTLERFAEAGFPEAKLHHVPTPVDVRNTEPKPCSNGPILFFGRVSPEKGVHHLLEAYRNLPEGKPPLVIVGTLGKTDYIDNLVSEYREAVFYEFLPREQLACHIQNAFCVVIPSVWYDNLPNVLIEAYAHGKPVIAPAHGCFLELVKDGETGLLYEAGNQGALQEKLSWALANSAAMMQMGKKGRKLVEEDFAPEKHYKKLLSIFESVL